jgi:hypothetical protein
MNHINEHAYVDQSGKRQYCQIPSFPRCLVESKTPDNGSSTRHFEDDEINALLSQLHRHVNELNLQITISVEKQRYVSDEMARNMIAMSNMANYLVIKGNNKFKSNCD